MVSWCDEGENCKSRVAGGISFGWERWWRRGEVGGLEGVGSFRTEPVKGLSGTLRKSEAITRRVSLEKLLELLFQVLEVQRPLAEHFLRPPPLRAADPLGPATARRSPRYRHLNRDGAPEPARYVHIRPNITRQRSVNSTMPPRWRRTPASDVRRKWAATATVAPRGGPENG